MPLYSHNRLSVYETCARQYRFQYLDRLEAPDEAQAVWVPEILAACFRKFWPVARIVAQPGRGRQASGV